MITIDVLSWIAIVVLSFGYWLQIWKIHVHKEVRDISIGYNIMLAIGFGILTITAIIEKSLIFTVKQIATTLPVIVIIIQIIYHRQDRWHDPSLPLCSYCKYELQTHYIYCPHCGKDNPEFSK